MIYLDTAATSPMRKEAINAYVETANKAFGNTQSLHDAGSTAAEYVTSSKQLWGRFLNGRAEGVYFTANATEGNQLTIRSLLRGRPSKFKDIITTKLEHASVLTTMFELEKEGYRINYIPVDEFGVIDFEEYKKAVNKETALVVMQLVNSEMGAIQPVESCADYAKQFGIPIHCDIVQGFGKIPLDLATLGVTSAVCSAHKIGGPKGVGVVYIDPSVHWESVYEGTTHQSGFRAGTVDVPAIVAATIAAKYALADQQDAYQQASRLQEFLTAHLPEGVQLVGNLSTKSPFIQGLILPHVEGQWMMLACNRQQIAISTGTACKIGYGEAMSAMSAIGFESDVARKFVRISFNQYTTISEVESFIQVINQSLIDNNTRVTQ
ncbi:IscS subfamily cysteine desulfurase [Paenisporosarcina sp. TG20]|uniref:IscS subfamily cysteine desulfurase n=1 Tax=Paenisporosarcina sp. TG20 TaxID=1211706 RepID=UPI0002DD8F30|nr:IscS subfamily cysteine desulfurase [Paenisporosarcina sp. TG20]